MSGTLLITTKIKADTKLTFLMCPLICYRKSIFANLKTWTKPPEACDRVSPSKLMKANMYF